MIYYVFICLHSKCPTTVQHKLQEGKDFILYIDMSPGPRIGSGMYNMFLSLFVNE